MAPRLRAKSLKVGVAANRALFMAEKTSPIGAKACVMLFTVLSSDGLFW